MTDCFALLDQPRRPWLDSDCLKQTFLAVSANCHPDRFHEAGEGQRRAAHDHYIELQAAYNRLRDPRQRLLHLLELETGTRPPELRTVPPDLGDLFLEIGRLCRETDLFLSEKSKAVSPMLKVSLFQRSQESHSALTQVQEQIRARRESLFADLKTVDKSWDEAPPASAERRQLLEQLQQLLPLLSYFGRWHDELQERITKLAL